MKTDKSGQERFAVYLLDCERCVEEEIAAGATRKAVALTYAFALRSPDPVDFARINKAILSKWALSGLTWIKKLAWA